MLLSLRRFNDVLKILVHSDHTYRAALLILACHQNNINLDNILLFFVVIININTKCVLILFISIILGFVTTTLNNP